ncbi:hypothetical protein BG006_008370 [Podila minutissima]|uniref:Uncharacterized protein n=1 Tax=Podila minutissima TaxID=64525 RepID=A0A9P5VK05_9FUNG|nr:hypothetical protein BG006_008370 [Podila minutissima]
MLPPIAKYLSIGDITTCVQVSRAFEAHFTPLLWHTVRLEQLQLVCRGVRSINGCPHKCALPNVIWHASSVKVLHLEAGTFVHGLNRLQKALLLECTNVENLEVEALEDDEGEISKELEGEAWAILAKFVKSNRQLRSVHHHTSLRYCNEAWVEALATLPVLEEIHVDNLIISSQQLARLLRVIPADAASINSITLCHLRIIGQSPCLQSIAPLNTFPVTRLSLNRLQEFDWNNYVELIRRCPNLISLNFYFLEPSKTRQRKFRVIDFSSRVLSRLQKLRELGLRSVVTNSAGEDTSTLLDEHFPGILRALPSKVVKLRLPDSGFSTNAFKTLQSEQHFKTIQELNFDKCDSFTSTMALDCLESCAELVKFVAPEVLMPEVLQRKDKPWRCTQMKHLQVWFHGMARIAGSRPCNNNTGANGATVRGSIDGCDKDRIPTGSDEHDALYKQLGKLTRLEYLDLGNLNVQSSFDQYQPECYRDFAGVDTPEPYNERGYQGWNGEYFPCTHFRDFAAYYIRFGQLRLGQGIGLQGLKGLKRLRFLGLENLGIKLARWDAKWMHDHWPALEVLKGSLHCESGKSVRRFALALGLCLEDEEDPTIAACLLEESEDELSDCGEEDSSDNESSE